VRLQQLRLALTRLRANTWPKLNERLLTSMSCAANSARSSISAGGNVIADCRIIEALSPRRKQVEARKPRA
jgi:hypothetical protein